MHHPFQLVVIAGVAMMQVQSSLNLLRFSWAYCSACLVGIPSLECVDCTTQLCAICKRAESALNPAVNVSDVGVFSILKVDGFSLSVWILHTV